MYPKPIFIFLCFLMSLGSISGQKLNHKIRTFGIGFYGNIGMGYPLNISTVSPGQEIDPVYPIFNSVGNIDEDFEGNEMERQPSFTLGAHAHLKRSFGTKFLMTLSGGFARTQVVYFFSNNNTSASGLGSWRERINFDQRFVGLDLGFPLGKGRGSFFTLGCRAALTNVSDPIFQQDVSGYEGITENNVRTRFFPATNETVTLTDELNEDVLVLTPSLKYLIQFGRYGAHAFEFGFSYHFTPSDNLVTSGLESRQSDVLVGSSQIDYQANFVAFELGYTIPIFRSKKVATTRQQRRFAKKSRPPKRPTTRPVSKGRQPVATKSPSRSDIPAPIRADYRSCFGNPTSDEVRLEEIPFKFNKDLVEFELYHKDGLRDGDVVTVCVDGNITHRNLELTDAGTRLQVSTQGRHQVHILVFTESAGRTGNTSLGISLLSGGQVNTIELDAFERTYYWFVMERVQ